MKSPFDLSKKEQSMALWLGGFFLLVLAYLLIYSPLADSMDEMQSSLSLKRNELAWMQQAATEARAMAGPKEVSGPSLLKAVDLALKKHKLGDSLNKIDPENDARARVWLEDLVYADLIALLRELDTSYRITVYSLSADRLAAPGYVNARLTLVSEQK